MSSPLQDWWRSTTEEELESLMPKVVAYGSKDLEVMGDVMLMSYPALVGKVAPEELAIGFYALGKIARIMGAYADGQVPSHDSWHDLAIYSRMALRVRDNGSWPGPVTGGRK
jgi:hypothetical protein